MAAMREPDWQCEGVSLYLGNCLEVLPKLGAGSVDAVVTDPPYGISNDADYTRFSGGLTESGRHRNEPIAGDEEPFDPSPWLGFPRVVLWGANCFSDKLTKASWLVWCKKRDSQLGTFLGDCELAWCKGGHAVHMYSHVWHGFDRDSERNGVLHPNQKPVALMKWCLERATVPDAGCVLDGYMGSGTVGVACIETGRKFIGIEIEPKYFEIAVNRIDQARRQGRLFTEATP